MWGQALAAFAIWIAYAFVLWRRQPGLARAAQGLSPRQVWARSLAWLLGASLAALGMLMGVGLLGGVQAGLLVPWGMAVVVLAGLVFVHGQTVAAVLIVVGSEARRTTKPRETSES